MFKKLLILVLSIGCISHQYVNAKVYSSFEEAAQEAGLAGMATHFKELESERQMQRNPEASEAQMVLADFSNDIQAKIARALESGIKFMNNLGWSPTLVIVNQGIQPIDFTISDDYYHATGPHNRIIQNSTNLETTADRNYFIKIAIGDKVAELNNYAPHLSAGQLALIVTGINHKGKIGARLFIYNADKKMFESTKILQLEQ